MNVSVSPVRRAPHNTYKSIAFFLNFPPVPCFSDLLFLSTLISALAAMGMQCGGDVPSGIVGQNLPFANLDVCCRKRSILTMSKVHVEQPIA